MSFVSYAQNCEDVMLWRALKDVNNGFYIDVGAAWPVEHSVTKAFYDRGWHGINIEPNPIHHASLANERQRDINLQLAVGAIKGSLTINLVGATGLSTLDCAIANKHQTDGWGIVQQTVSIVTLAEVCLQYVPPGQEIHFLKVDVEGFEEQALKGHSWTKYRPWIVLVEATLPMTQQESYEAWEPILLNANYCFAYADGLNRYYVAKEHVGLAFQLKYPPNVFDSFVLIDQQNAEAKFQQAQEKLSQAETKSKQAQEKLIQAEVREQQLKEQLVQAEIKVKQAEAMVNQKAAYLEAVYISTSWRITAPFRWTVIQAQLLSKHGLPSRLKALAKKILCKVAREILRRPDVHYRLLRLTHRLGLYYYLKRLQSRVTDGVFQSLSGVPLEVEELSPFARRIHARLKIACSRKENEEA